VIRCHSGASTARARNPDSELYPDTAPGFRPAAHAATGMTVGA
jgi:hypothetical protein